MTTCRLQKIHTDNTTPTYKFPEHKKGRLTAQWFVEDGRLICKWFVV
jgi:hypothetical protein